MTQCPEKRTLYECMYCPTESKFVYWLDTVTDFEIPPDAQFHQIIVPTVDTLQYSYLLKQAIKHQQPLMFIGSTGTGKSALMRNVLLDTVDKAQSPSPSHSSLPIKFGIRTELLE